MSILRPASFQSPAFVSRKIPYRPPFYLASGLISASDCLLAYQAKGAASLAASKVNLANPGTYDAAAGVDPTWDATGGWTFNGTSQYLTTGLTPASNQSYSMFVRYSDASTGSYITIAGTYTDANAGFLIQYDSGSNKMVAYNGKGYPSGITSNSPKMVSGVYGFAGRTLYRNGTAEGTLIPSGSATSSWYGICVGAQGGASISLYFNGKIQALSIYSITLSATQAASLATEMAAI